MSNSIIDVDPQILEEKAQKLEEADSEYERLYSSLYAEIEKMSANWKGKDNTAYTNQILAYKKNIIKISEVMKQYVLCLRNCARSYKEMQDEIANRASRL